MTERQNIRTRITRTILLRAIPASIFILVLGGCLGFVPPPASSLSAFIALSTTWVLGRLRHFRLAVLVGCFGAFVAVGLLWPSVQIRAATPDDSIHNRYFGAPDDSTARNIAVLYGWLSVRSWVEGSLYHVKDAKIERINAFDVGRSGNQVGGLYFEPMTLTFALVTYKAPTGTITRLGCAGAARGGGNNSELPTDVPRNHYKCLGGRLFSGQTGILYVEGDTTFRVSRSMTVQEFAKENSGEFLVVHVKMN